MPLQVAPLALPRPAEDPLAASASAMRDAILSVARRPSYGVSIALAGVVSRSWQVRGPQYLPLYGLDALATRNLLEEHFPGLGAALGEAWADLVEPATFADAIELEDMVALLLEHRTVADEDSRWLAHAIATACLSSDHLWQDMNLPSRGVLTQLLNGFFTSLAVCNRQDMKWKKFLYLQLCEKEDVRVCKSPSCGECVDYALCFGPEEGRGG